MPKRAVPISIRRSPPSRAIAAIAAPANLEKRLERLLSSRPGGLAAESTAIFSGSSGMPELASREKVVLEHQPPGAAIRGFRGGHRPRLEAVSPWGWRWPPLPSTASQVPAFDGAHEKQMTSGTKAVVTTVGHQRGEGVAALSADA